MYSKILILRFPKTKVQKPLVCLLTKDYDLTFNILNATILPRKVGIMVLELSGTKSNFNAGVQYLKNHGVDVQSANQEIIRNENKCTHCGACTAVCTTSALSIKRPEMTVDFNQEKCSVCKLCISACPPRVIELSSNVNCFF